MFALLFAWSWGGHGQITAAAVALAISAVVKLGRSGLFSQLKDLASKVLVARYPEMPSGYTYSTPEAAMESLLEDLPARVQAVDLHLGNLPVVGEKIDKSGQVRHFMRSTEATTSREAYRQSMGWIRSHLVKSWQKMSDAVNKKYEWYEVFSSNATDFLQGLGEMADALHTVEDSFAQGHATRDEGNTNLIRGLNYWDAANKKGDAGAGRLGHEEYDDPNRPENKPFVAAAKATAGELIACVLGNLDQSSSVFTTDLDQKLKLRFNFSPPMGDYPMPSGNVRAG